MQYVTNTVFCFYVLNQYERARTLYASCVEIVVCFVDRKLEKKSILVGNLPEKKSAGEVI